MEGTEGLQPQIPKEPEQLNLDLKPLITESKPFDIFTRTERTEFENAIKEERVSEKLVEDYRKWQEEDKEQQRQDSSPRYGH